MCMCLFAQNFKKTLETGNVEVESHWVGVCGWEVVWGGGVSGLLPVLLVSVCPPPLQAESYIMTTDHMDKKAGAQPALDAEKGQGEHV